MKMKRVKEKEKKGENIEVSETANEQLTHVVVSNFANCNLGVSLLAE